jgi:hypothetical protein
MLAASDGKRAVSLCGFGVCDAGADIRQGRRLAARSFA